MNRHSAGRVPQHADRGGTPPPCARSQPCLNLLADQGVRDGVEEPSDLDVIVDANPGKRPFGGVLVIGVGQRSCNHRAFDRLEQLPPADPETAHHSPVQLHQNLGDRRVAFGRAMSPRLRSRPSR